MTKLADIYGLLCELDIPVTYRQFSGPKESIPDPPYIAYYEGRSDNTGADNTVLAENISVVVELYTDCCRDFDLEYRLKTLLLKNGIFYNTDHADIQEEDIHIAYFNFTLTE